MDSASALAASPVPVVNVAPGKIRSPGLVFVFTLLTLGIYAFYWYWVTLDDLKMWRGGKGWSGPMVLLILIPFVGLAVIAVPFLIPSYLRELYTNDGKTSPVSGATGLWLLVPLIGGIIYFVQVQGALNQFWKSKGAQG